jgi:hypothetical protein
MTYFLVQFKNNWSDEFDVEGFRVFDQDELAEFYSLLDLPNMFPNEYEFGTNELIEFDTKEEYLECLTIGQIAVNEAKFLRKVFGGPQYGKFYYPELPEDTEW